MQKGLGFGILAVVLLGAMAIFAGCIEQEEASPSIPTPEVTLSPSPTLSEVPVKTEALTWTLFTSPQGRFTIYIPEGWAFKSYSDDESNIAFSPRGENIPEVGILVYFAVNPADIKQKMSAAEFLETVMVPLFRTTIPDLAVESIVPLSDTVAEMTLSGTYYNQPVTSSIVCYMDYLYDETMPSPTLSTEWSSMGGWYNFGFLTLAVASARDLPELKPLAAQMTGSFKPNAQWLSEVRDSLAWGMATRAEMVKGTIARITAMEYNQRMSEMQSNYNIGLGWINALGGTVDVRNPGTGEVWHVDNSYSYYYQRGTDIVATNEPFAPTEPGWTQLEIAR